MPIYSFDPLADRRWSDLVDRHPRATVFHTQGWLACLRQTYGYEPVGLTTSSPERALQNGIIFCRVRSWLTGSRLVSLPFSDHCQPLFEESKELREILCTVSQTCGPRMWKYIEVRPSGPDTNSIFEAAGFSRGKEFRLHTLSLDRSLDELFQAFNKSSVQRKIRRAERDGVVYREGTSKEFLSEFYNLMVMTRRRHGLPPQPIAWFRNLARALEPGLKVRLAIFSGRAIASIITLSHCDTMVYKYGCSDLRFSNSGANAFLFWHMIQDAKLSGKRNLDLGRGENDQAGLARFKSNWGASVSDLTYWRLPAAAAGNNPAIDKFGMGRHLVRRLPRALFIKAGELFYRHMG